MSNRPHTSMSSAEIETTLSEITDTMSAAKKDGNGSEVLESYGVAMQILKRAVHRGDVSLKEAMAFFDNMYEGTILRQVPPRPDGRKLGEILNRTYYRMATA